MRGSENSKGGWEADLFFVDGKERISKLVETVIEYEDLSWQLTTILSYCLTNVR